MEPRSRHPENNCGEAKRGEKGEKNIQASNQHPAANPHRSFPNRIYPRTINLVADFPHHVRTPISTMAQGTVKQKVKTAPKKSVSSTPSSQRRNNSTNKLSRGARPTGPQTGNRVIKPKKAALIKQQQMKKVRSTIARKEKGGQEAYGYCKTEALSRPDNLDRTLSR